MLSVSGEIPQLRHDVTQAKRRKKPPRQLRSDFLIEQRELVGFGFVLDDDRGADKDQQDRFPLRSGLIGEKALEEGDFGEDGCTLFTSIFSRDSLATEEERAAVRNADDGVKFLNAESGELDFSSWSCAADPTDTASCRDAGLEGEGGEADQIGDLRMQIHGDIFAIRADSGRHIENWTAGDDRGNRLECRNTCGSDGSKIADVSLLFLHSNEGFLIVEYRNTRGENLRLRFAGLRRFEQEA